MVKANGDFARLSGDYLFTEVARRAAVHEAAHPGVQLLRLGIGDVPGPLPAAAAEAMAQAAQELGTPGGFRGYGPEQGYLFLREAILRADYLPRGVKLDPAEVFISDGAKTDCGGLLELFAPGKIALCDPVYPAYADSALLAGWDLCWLSCTEDNGFLPEPEGVDAVLVWLCYPNNPTGVMADRKLLRRWVDWANDRGSVILFDGAYEAFIADPVLPHSIYEIPGAERCAIEVRSFSKTAGFTGVRCGYTVVPETLRPGGAPLRALWARRQAARFNGVSYVTQRGAEAVCMGEGRSQALAGVAACRETARQMRAVLTTAGITVSGGEHAPYLWMKTPAGLSSWDCFDRLLEQAGVVTTPGSGFGTCGEGWLRLTSFGERENSLAAARRIAEELA